jgi:plasmid stability protein
MASITIRNLDDSTKSRLRIRAARHGRSMEDEARDLLRTVLSREPSIGPNLLQTIRRRFAKIGAVELEIPARDPLRDPPDFTR